MPARNASSRASARRQTARRVSLGAPISSEVSGTPPFQRATNAAIESIFGSSLSSIALPPAAWVKATRFRNACEWRRTRPSLPCDVRRGQEAQAPGGILGSARFEQKPSAQVDVNALPWYWVRNLSSSSFVIRRLQRMMWVCSCFVLTVSFHCRQFRWPILKL